MYDRLREMADGMNAESIDQLLQTRVGDNLSEDEIERREHDYLRSMLEPKYVIVKHGGRYEFRARYVDYHRTLLSYDEIRRGMCDGGGFWGVDGEQKRVTLYDSSSDFGRPKNIEAAIRQDGANLLEMLGRECDKTGAAHFARADALASLFGLYCGRSGAANAREDFSIAGEFTPHFVSLGGGDNETDRDGGFRRWSQTITLRGTTN